MGVGMGWGWLGAQPHLGAAGVVGVGGVWLGRAYKGMLSSVHMANTSVNCILQNATDPTQCFKMGSIKDAAQFISDMEVQTGRPDPRLDRRFVGRAMQTGKQVCGWIVKRDAPAPAPVIPAPAPSATTSPLTFVFGEEAAELFRGKNVRVTLDQRVSVFDVIKVVCDIDNPRQSFDGLCLSHPEVVSHVYNFQFPGQGQRATPVVNVQGMIEIINLLPGENAARFRAGGARLLVRFLGGDESLVDEVRAVQQHHATGLSQGTITRLCHEQVQADRPANPYALISPTMHGKSFNDFVDKEVCYIITFTKDDQSYIKFGFTNHIHTRMTSHMSCFPGMQIFTVLSTPNPKRLEGAFKTRMRHNGHLIEMVVNGEKQVEILTGITPEDAERELIALCQRQWDAGEREIELQLKREETRQMELKLKTVGQMLDKLGCGLTPELFQSCLSSLFGGDVSLPNR